MINEKNRGRKVELVSINDEHTTLRKGDKGTYQYINTFRGMILHAVKWDNGSNLMLIEGQDEITSFLLTFIFVIPLVIVTILFLLDVW